MILHNVGEMYIPEHGHYITALTHARACIYISALKCFKVDITQLYSLAFMND